MTTDFTVRTADLADRADVARDAAQVLRSVALPVSTPAGRSTDEIAGVIRQLAADTDAVAGSVTAMAAAFIAAAQEYDAADDAVADALRSWDHP